jgi:hypothetical protein
MQKEPTVKSVTVRNLLSFGDEAEAIETRHGFPILGRLNPTTVRARCPHADALLNLLAARLPIS